MFKVEKPIDCIFLTTRFRFDLGSALEGFPSGVYTSQINLATFPYLGSSQDRTSQVSKSGFKYMSASIILTKPSIEEPSNITFPFKAFSSWATGISTDLIVPMISVNINLTYLTFSFFAFFKMSSLE